MSYHALLFCPEDKTARVVTQVLNELDFTVELSNEPFAAVKKLMAQHFDAIVVDCENEQNATLLFKSARNSSSNQTSLSVAVVEGQAGVAKAFRIGANLVLTKPINVEQSKGTLRVARGLLRKADSAKPAGAALSSTVPSFSAPQTPAPHALTSSPDSAFEREKDPAPEPEPTEAALLESMPDPLSAPGHPATPPTATPSMKEYPWQPVSKPLAEPMASALRRAAETAGKPSPDAPPESAMGSAGLTRSKEGGLPAAGALPHPSTATAATHAKDSSRPSSNMLAFKPAASAAPAPKREDLFESAHTPPVEPPSFSALEDRETADTGVGKKKFLIAAILLIALGTAGYFGMRMHSNASAPVQQEVAPAQNQAPEATPESTNPEPAPATPEIQSKPGSQPTSEPQAEQTTLPSTTKTASAPKATVIASTSGPAAKTSAATPEPVLVKSDASKPALQNLVASEPVQPPALGVAPNGDDQAISGLLSATPANVPRPPAQTLRISQGISQGLLMKRVQPVYPAQARQMRVQGVVQLQATIGKDGSVTNVKPLDGDSILARAAMDAVRQWKYKPYLLNGEPVEIQTQITVNFKLP